MMADLGRRIPGLRAAFRFLGLLVLTAVLLAAPARAETASPGQNLPPQIETLMKILADPEVQSWARDHKIGVPEAAAESTAPPAHSGRVSHALADYVAAIRGQIYRHAAALANLPAEFNHARQILLEDIAESGVLGLLGLMAALVCLSLAARSVYRRMTGGYLRQLEDAAGASAMTKFVARTKRYALSLAETLTIGLAAMAVFVALEYWPDVIERIILAFIVAYVCWMVVRIASRYLLESQDGFRVVPASDEEARFWERQTDLLAGLASFGSAVVLSICLLGFSAAACDVLAYALGLVILCILVYSLMKTPAGSAADENHQRSRRPHAALLSLVLIVLWCVWALGATPAFLMGILIVGVVLAIKLAGACVQNCFRYLGDSVAVGGNAQLTAVFVERAIRFGLIMLALALTLWIWEVDFETINSVDTRTSRLIHGLIVAGIILLAANFIWSLLKTLIDQRIEKTRAEADPEQVNRFATLLPVLRNFLWAAIAAFAILMALSELGVEIGPLIAGAGVAGVAIGFGAQTLVKDIISGIFYLVDDAFRVGEYIESGSYKGTVESFSLRSVRLRHNRGPIYTVPFGVLGAIQNMSRDWVIDKLKLTVTYDSDVEKARKIIKRIGLELAEDPELKAVTLEPLKMQGVQDFGDYGVILTLKLKTKPGQQFLVRRKAMVLIKKEFEANGIRFASPSIQITGQTPLSPELQAAAASHPSAVQTRPTPAT
ncbi:MAG: mechanosensitive ion channel family protein [Hyphomicrobiales bacterium]